MRVVGESKSSVFPMRIRCRRVEDSDGFAYGKEVDFCGKELEVEESDVKKHPWFKYPNYTDVDYGVKCPMCGMFVVIDEDKLPKYVKEKTEEIRLSK